MLKAPGTIGTVVTEWIMPLIPIILMWSTDSCNWDWRWPFPQIQAKMWATLVLQRMRMAKTLTATGLRH